MAATQLRAKPRTRTVIRKTQKAVKPIGDLAESIAAYKRGEYKSFKTLKAIKADIRNDNE